MFDVEMTGTKIKDVFKVVPLLVINGVVIPLIGVKEPYLPMYKAIYRGELTPSITTRGPPCYCPDFFLKEKVGFTFGEMN